MGKQYRDKIRFHIQSAAARGWSGVDGFQIARRVSLVLYTELVLMLKVVCFMMF